MGDHNALLNSILFILVFHESAKLDIFILCDWLISPDNVTKGRYWLPIGGCVREKRGRRGL